MDVESTEPQPTPPVPGAAGSYEPYRHEPKPRGGRGWIIALVVILATLALLMFGCFAMFAAIGGSSEPLAMGDAVAVIYLDGTIATTGSSLDGITSPEYMMDQLDQAAADDSVKAVVLRVDSPGGTVAASEEMAMTVADFVEYDKPVVVSVGDIGASGAYMVASQCDHIVALPTSSIGSIGVIMQIPNLQGLMDKVGVEWLVLTRGELKDAGSPFRSATASDIAYFNEDMDLAYDRFIEIVAEGRGMDEDEVRELASGRTWMGTKAIDLGLIDELGTMDDAIDAAAELGEIEGDPRLVYYEDYAFEDLLTSFIGFTSQFSVPDASLRELQEPPVPR